MEEKHYRIIWVIDAFATTPMEAIQEAMAKFPGPHNPESTANVFEVEVIKNGNVVSKETIDLSDENVIYNDRVKPIEGDNEPDPVQGYSHYEGSTLTPVTPEEIKEYNKQHDEEFNLFAAKEDRAIDDLEQALWDSPTGSPEV